MTTTAPAAGTCPSGQLAGSDQRRFAAIGGWSGPVPLGPLLSSVLFGVSPIDPLTVAATATVLGSVALVAAWWPASVASRVDPVVALRYE